LLGDQIFITLEAAGADFLSAAVGHFGPLEVKFLGDSAGWIKFGCANTVGVAPTGHRTSFTDWTCFRHKSSYVIINTIMPQDASIITIIFSLAILVMSVVVHEVSHGYVAYILGDPTAKYAGRLTLNPLKHLDWFGSVLVPIFTSLAGFPFGWANPVPYNPYNLKAGKWGPALVAIAGPASNLLLVVVFGLILRFFHGPAPEMLMTIMFVNISLAIFNLLPVAPLDGSKLLFALLPYHLRYIEEFMIRNQLYLVLFLIIFLNSSGMTWLVNIEYFFIRLILGV